MMSIYTLRWITVMVKNYDLVKYVAKLFIIIMMWLPIAILIYWIIFLLIFPDIFERIGHEIGTMKFVAILMSEIFLAVLSCFSVIIYYIKTIMKYAKVDKYDVFSISGQLIVLRNIFVIFALPVMGTIAAMVIVGRILRKYFD